MVSAERVPRTISSGLAELLLYEIGRRQKLKNAGFCEGVHMKWRGTMRQDRAEQSNVWTVRKANTSHAVNDFTLDAEDAQKSGWWWWMSIRYPGAEETGWVSRGNILKIIAIQFTIVIRWKWLSVSGLYRMIINCPEEVTIEDRRWMCCELVNLGKPFPLHMIIWQNILFAHTSKWGWSYFTIYTYILYKQKLKNMFH